MTPRDPIDDEDERPDSLRLVGWVAGVTLILVIVLGLLAYADIWLF